MPVWALRTDFYFFFTFWFLHKSRSWISSKFFVFHFWEKNLLIRKFQSTTLYGKRRSFVFWLGRIYNFMKSDQQIISSITDLYIMLFQFKLLSQKSWKSKNHVFRFRDVLFTFFKCALQWANSKRKLSWNETIAIRGTKPFKVFCCFC